jgi:bifunctional UDP-N-acetylglucosamine pyrophosphorylase/glucosamine-1-phosphate N-acetyltransferase
MVFMRTPVTVVILAAGLGTRMRSRQAKVLHRAGGKPLVEHVVETALHVAPAERIFVVVGYQADRVRDALAATGVGFIEQSEQKGTGHAVLAGREALAALGGRLVVLYGDSPLLRPETLTGLREAAASGEAACVLLTALMDDPTGYGRVIRGPNGRVTAIVEQKAGSPEQLAIREANMGIYCFRADLFWRHAGEMGTGNPAGEYYLTDMAEILSRAGHAVEAMPMDDPREALGINTRVDLAEVDGILRDRKRRELMLAGVTIESPQTVLIDAGVRVGMDTAIGPFVQIRGTTTIGENCRIGAHSIVFDSEIADGVEIGPYTIVGASVVERNAVVGPYARLRFDNHVGEGAHIGNFVELKKTRMGAGAKANHLAYLGDADIGARSNIGAGTITCNYDGVHKHRTTIAEGAFVGSNSTLVAPLDIGEGAYIAAGSVITQAVPPDALAIGRARQDLKEGWAKKRRKRQGR